MTGQTEREMIEVTAEAKQVMVRVLASGEVSEKAQFNEAMKMVPGYGGVQHEGNRVRLQFAAGDVETLEALVVEVRAAGVGCGMFSRDASIEVEDVEVLLTWKPEATTQSMNELLMRFNKRGITTRPFLFDGALQPELGTRNGNYVMVPPLGLSTPQDAEKMLATLVADTLAAPVIEKTSKEQEAERHVNLQDAKGQLLGIEQKLRETIKFMAEVKEVVHAACLLLEDGEQIMRHTPTSNAIARLNNLNNGVVAIVGRIEVALASEGEE